MENLITILPSVLSSGVLSESISGLASALGYKSRATLYRIIDGTASKNAVNDFCHKLDDIFYLDEDLLRKIYNTIQNTAGFNKLMKAETGNFTKAAPIEVLEAFILHDYTLFSDDFRAGELVPLQRLEQTDPDAFFFMLAYFYFKSLKINFYESGKTHKERCARIMEPLGRRLMTLYPANGIAAKTVFIYSQSSIFDSEPPILWGLIASLATMLKQYGTPDIGRIVAKGMYLVPFLPERTYWRANGQPDLLLMRAVRHTIPGSGYYDIFKVNLEGGKVESIGVMTFLSEKYITYRNKLSGDAGLGMFVIDEDELQVMLANEKNAPAWMEHRWQRQSLQNSRSLRDYDKSLSDNILDEKALLAEGYVLLTNLSVVNVGMSRRSVRISLADGSIHEISYKAAPFLEYILPSNDVIVGERISDGEIFVSWPQLLHCIPLRLFTQIKPPSCPWQ